MNGTRARLVRLDGIEPSPWRNGGGRTRELVAWPTTQDWQLRFSVADILEDGPFSPYPGVLRDFCVLDGTGVLLRWSQGREQRVQAGDPPLRFDGADPPHAKLIDGPTRDLNLMLRHGMDARLLPNDGRPRSRPWGCFVAEARRVVIDDTTFEVPGAALVWFEDDVRRASFAGHGWWLARDAGAPA